MLSRRWLLGLMAASVILSGAHATPVQAGAGGGNTKKFMDRQAAKQKARKEKRKKAEEKQGATQ